MVDLVNKVANYFGHLGLIFEPPPHKIVGLKVQKNSVKEYRWNTNFDYQGWLKIMIPFGITWVEVAPPLKIVGLIV